jgi:hypothetical protein
MCEILAGVFIGYCRAKDWRYTGMWFGAQHVGVFAELGKATLIFVISVCTSFRLSNCIKQLGSYWKDFREI